MWIGQNLSHPHSTMFNPSGNDKKLDGFVVCIAQQAELRVKDIASVFQQNSGKSLVHNEASCNIFK